MKGLCQQKISNQFCGEANKSSLRPVFNLGTAPADKIPWNGTTTLPQIKFSIKKGLYVIMSFKGSYAKFAMFLCMLPEKNPAFFD